MHLELTTDQLQAEYVTRLPLPPGVFVSGFRLHIDGHPVPGRITEKKTALWIYTMIRDSERRDPGLLYYDQGNELELRVYPVTSGAPSVVEIDVLFPAAVPSLASAGLPREPAALLAALAPSRLSPGVITPSATVFSGPFPDLPAAPVEPYLHLIVDRSRDNGYTTDWRQALPALQAAFPDARLGRVTFAHHDAVDLAEKLEPLEALAAQPDPALRSAGSLALDLVLARALRQHRDFDLDRPHAFGSLPPRPIFVVLRRTHSAKSALGLADAWSAFAPALELHQMDAAGTLHATIANTNATSPLLRLGESIRPLSPHHPLHFPASAGPLTYWAPSEGAWLPVPGVRIDPSEANTWTSAVALHARQFDHTLNPGAGTDDLRALVSASRDAGILIPVTSYIVVENPAQWNVMAKAEAQKLDQHAALDHKEASAPGMLWLALPFAAWLYFGRTRTRSTPPLRPA